MSVSTKEPKVGDSVLRMFQLQQDSFGTYISIAQFCNPRDLESLWQFILSYLVHASSLFRAFLF
jgi:hypothetical protein